MKKRVLSLVLSIVMALQLGVPVHAAYKDGATEASISSTNDTYSVGDDVNITLTPPPVAPAETPEPSATAVSTPEPTVLPTPEPTSAPVLTPAYDAEGFVQAEEGMYPGMTAEEILASLGNHNVYKINNDVSPKRMRRTAAFSTRSTGPYVFLYENGDLVFTDNSTASVSKGEVLMFATDIEITPYGADLRPAWGSSAKDIRRVIFEAEVAPISLAYWFAGCEQLTEFVNIENLRTNNVVSLDYTFYQCYALTTVDLSNFDTGAVVSMAHTFDSMSHLETIDVSSFDTSNVTNMEGLFRGLAAITALDISNFVTDKVKTYDYFMYGCQNITGMDVSSLSVKGFEDYNGANGFKNTNPTGTMDMFTSCLRLRKIVFGEDFAFRANTGLPTQSSTYVPLTEGKWYNNATRTTTSANIQNSSYNIVGLPKFQAATLYAYTPVTVTFDPNNGEEKIVVEKEIGDAVGALPEAPSKDGANFIRWGFKPVRPTDVVNGAITIKAIYDDDQEARAVMYSDNTLVFQRGPRTVAEHGEIVDYFEGIEEPVVAGSGLYTPIIKFTSEETGGHPVYSQGKPGTIVNNQIPGWAIYATYRYISEDQPKDWCFDTHIEAVEFADEIHPVSTVRWFMNRYVGKNYGKDYAHGGWDGHDVYFDYNVPFKGLDKLDMSNVVNASYMFCSHKQGYRIYSNSNKEDINSDIRGLGGREFTQTEINDIEGWKFDNLIDASYMFGSSSSRFEGWPSASYNTGVQFNGDADFSGWSFPALTNAMGMFGSHSAYVDNSHNAGAQFNGDADLSGWTFPALTTARGMFGSDVLGSQNNIGAQFNGNANLSGWSFPVLNYASGLLGLSGDTDRESNCDNAGVQFNGDVDLSNWSLPALKSVSGLLGASGSSAGVQFNGDEVTGFDSWEPWVNKLGSTESMFCGVKFPEKQKICITWGLSGVTNTTKMFANVDIGAGIELPNATFANVTTAQRMFGCFYKAYSNIRGGINLPVATFEKCKNTEEMFGAFCSKNDSYSSCTIQGDINLPVATFESVTSATAMFGAYAAYSSCYSSCFIQGDINLPVATFENITYATEMFGASSGSSSCSIQGKINIKWVNDGCPTRNNIDVRCMFNGNGKPTGIKVINISGMNNMLDYTTETLNSGSVQEIRVGPGARKTIFPTPNPKYIKDADGYWYTSTGEKYAPNEIPGYTANVYYAITPRTVTFDPANGEDTVSFQVPYMGNVKRPTPDPIKAGYEFIGWGTEDGTIWKFTDPVTKNMTLTAQYIDRSECVAIQYSNGEIVFQRGITTDASKGSVVQMVRDIEGQTYTAPIWTVAPDSITKATISGQLFPVSTAYWFAGLSNLESVDGLDYIGDIAPDETLSSYMVENTAHMFDGCESLTYLNLGRFSTYKVEDSTDMFANMPALNTIVLGGRFEFKDGNYLPENNAEGVWYYGDDYKEYAPESIPGNTGDSRTYTTNIETYTVSFDTGALGTEYADQSVRFNRKATNPGRPTRPGFNFVKWVDAADTSSNPAEFSFSTAIRANTTVKAVWNPKNNIPYTKEIWIEDLETDSYTKQSSQTLRGTAGATVEFDVSSVTVPEHYHINAEASTLTGEILGDGSLALKVMLERDRHKILFNVDGGEAIETKTGLKYQQSVELPTPTKPGYNFLYWTTAMGAPVKSPLVVQRDYGLIAKWTALDSVTYTVNSYIQDVEGDGYTFSGTETRTGSTDAMVFISSVAPIGFRLNPEKSTITGTVEANGQAEFDLYFDRILYNITFDSDGGTETEGIVKARYGTIAHVEAPTKAGYVFNGWKTTKKTDAAGEYLNVAFPCRVVDNWALKAIWAPGTAAYKVETYAQDLKGEGYSKTNTKTLSATTDSEVNAAVVVPDGRILNTDRSILTGTVNADGSLVLKIYLDRVSRTITLDSDGGSVIAPITVRDGDTVTPTTPTKQGYEFGGWHDVEGNVVELPITATSDMTIKATWTPIDGTAYTVDIYIQQVSGDGYDKTSETRYAVTDSEAMASYNPAAGFAVNVSKSTCSGIVSADGSLTLSIYVDRETYTVTLDTNGGAALDPITARYEADITPAIPVRPGYRFAGWTADESVVEPPIHVTGDMTLKATWIPEDGTRYIIEVYHQALDRSGYQKVNTVDCLGQTDSMAKAEISAPVGMVLNSGKSILEGTVVGDGSLTLEVYFDRIDVTVSFDTRGGSDVAPVTVVSGNNLVGYDIPDPVRSGMIFTGWDRDFTYIITADTVIYASWELDPDHSTVSGVVTDSSGKPVPYAHVTIKAGNTVYKETDTDKDGRFSILGVADGAYNLVTEKDGLITTSLLTVNVSQDNSVRSIILDDDAINSILSVNEGTKDVVVGGLDTLYKTEVYTKEDAEIVAKGGSATISMNVKGVQAADIPETAQELTNKALDEKKSIMGFMQMSIHKTITTAEGESTVNNLEELPQLLQIIDPLMEEQKGKTGYVVYRMHDGEVTTITTTPNENGAYITVGDDYLTIFASKFSDYCLAFDAPKPSTPNYSGGSSSGGNKKPNKKPEKIEAKPMGLDLLRDDHIAYIVGFPDGTIRPEAEITRAEVAMIFFRLMRETALSTYGTNNHHFTDVECGAWCERAIATLTNAGILKGRGNGTFDPSAPITRAEFAVICSRFDTVVEGKIAFKDVPADHWAYKEIASAVANGWAEGRTTEVFAPEEYITRAETITLINRVLHRATDKLNISVSIKKDVKEWPDNKDQKWYYIAIQEATHSHDYGFDAENVESWTYIRPIKVRNE